MIDLSRRTQEPEALDGVVAEDEIRRSLADLRFVNRWLSDSDRLVRSVRALLEETPRPRVLDVGCGSGDLLERIRRDIPGAPLLVGADIKHAHLKLAPPQVQAVVSDIRRLPFAPKSFDLVMVSHFLHHLDDPELPVILTRLFALCRRALVINDLERARVPYLFGRIAFPLLFSSRISMEDGLVSIRRGFRASELAAAFRKAEIPVRIARCWPYRLLAIAVREGETHGMP